ncbi:MAG: hypothetical protein ACKOPG_00345 [Novosphingobium sp.]
MLRRFLFSLVLGLALSACGRGSEDFTVNIARPASTVASAFGHRGLDGDITALFPGLKVVRTEPVPGEVLYTIPGDGDFPATIKLTFESTDSGKTTVVHAAVDTPRTKIRFGGKDMVISESLVERMVRGILRSASSKMEEGRSTEEEQRDFSRMLTVLAIATDSKQMRLAQDITKYPEWYMAGLGWLSGVGDGPSNPYGEFAEGDDPNMAARMDESAQRRAEREEQEKTAENSQAMDDARGDSARGEDPDSGN